MRINNKIWILAAVAVAFLVFIVFNQLGIDTMALISVILKYAIPLAVLGYLVILAKCCVVKMQEPKTSMGLDAKVDMLKDSLDRIEEKVDKIDRILEKVSE